MKRRIARKIDNYKVMPQRLTNKAMYLYLRIRDALEPVNKRQELQHLLRHGQLGTCPHLLTLLSRRARRTRIRLRCVAR